MIVAFKTSLRVAIFGGIALGASAALCAWLWAANGSQSNRIFFTLLAAFVGVNIALYLARMFAMREYQTRLLLFYEKLEPQKMINSLQMLVSKKMDASTRCTLMVHIANAELYAGNTSKALEILSQIQMPPKALEMRGLVLSNSATCHLWENEIDKANECINALRAIIANTRCKREFAKKAKHTVGYLFLCLNIRNKKQVDLKPLIIDCENSRSPLHLLDAQYYLALAYHARGDKASFDQCKDYVIQHGQHTALPKRLEQMATIK